AGNDLLVQVGERLRALLAPEDTLARFDGNTFALLIASVDEESEVASLVEHRIYDALKRAFTIQGTEIRISTRSGIALFPSDGPDPDTLIGNAETALKKARSAGGRYMFYAPNMNARVAEKLTLETKLRRAIENEEFILHYQPKVDLKTGLLVGLEALIRWQDPASGLVSPAQFIPVLEDTGLILDVGRWVLGRAAAQHAEWLARGLNPPRIAVNVSAIQLAQNDFVRCLDDMLARYPSAGSGIDLEITESVFVDGMTGNVEKLREARQRGLLVALDDFGTGYSSLGYLSRLPIDALKIDRSFVIHMSEDPQNTAIVTTIISLAHALDLKVIAEGVETLVQAQFLRLLRCDQIQGYLTARPQPAEQVAQLLGKRLLDLSATRTA
ncbi:MAG TPA: bifunctional diguanylate cyclase/phosphodiesterase, partial [Polyangiaceae bacterium]|nr:bifunctional diguanylate cyclase/phosphodiesterase [Polyangiaceae bacterium]